MNFGANGLQNEEAERIRRRATNIHRGGGASISARLGRIVSSRQNPQVFISQTTKAVRGAFLKKGGELYSLYRGTYEGNNVIFKRAELQGNNDALVHNDVSKTMDLQSGCGIARIFYCDIKGSTADVVAEQYYVTFSEVVVNARFSDLYFEFKPEEICRGLFTVLHDLRSANVIHNDLRMSKMFIHKKSKFFSHEFINLII